MKKYCLHLRTAFIIFANLFIFLFYPTKQCDHWMWRYSPNRCRPAPHRPKWPPPNNLAPPHLLHWFYPPAWNLNFNAALQDHGLRRKSPGGWATNGWAAMYGTAWTRMATPPFRRSHSCPIWRTTAKCWHVERTICQCLIRRWRMKSYSMFTVSKRRFDVGQ